MAYELPLLENQIKQHENKQNERTQFSDIIRVTSSFEILEKIKFLKNFKCDL